MGKRLDLLHLYLQSIFVDFELEIASSDASFRRYFRVFVDSKSYIVMDAPPEKEKVDDFVNITKLFRQNNINTPKIYFENKELGFLVLSDFGNITLLQKPKLEFYKTAIDELIKIQNIREHNLANYSVNILKNEMSLCQEWFKQDFDYQDIFDFLLDNITQHKQVVVHRDYHSRNIMLTHSGVGIIDFQDAVFGSYAYDIASLLKDAYIDLDTIEVLQKYYFEQRGLEDFEQFIFDFDMIATQRHLKILGIFKRLSIRDGKDNYLQDLPLVQKYLIEVSQKYPQLQKLQELCK